MSSNRKNMQVTVAPKTKAEGVIGDVYGSNAIFGVVRSSSTSTPDGGRRPTRMAAAMPEPRQSGVRPEHNEEVLGLHDRWRLIRSSRTEASYSRVSMVPRRRGLLHEACGAEAEGLALQTEATVADALPTRYGCSCPVAAKGLCGTAQPFGAAVAKSSARGKA
jgi:hypothetical protein